MVFSHASFASLCLLLRIMSSLVCLSRIRQPKLSNELRTSTALKQTKNLSQQHIVLCRQLEGLTRQTLVIPTVRTVTKLDTGLEHVGQKVVELKGKDHARSVNRIKRGARIRRDIRGRIEPIRPFVIITRTPNRDLHIPHIW